MEDSLVHIYAIFPLITIIASLATGVYVLLIDSKSRMRRAFFMLTFWIFLATVGDFGRMFTNDEVIALRFFHLKWMGLVFIQPAVLDLVLIASVWAKKWDTTFVQTTIYAPALALLALDAMGGVFNGVTTRPWGIEPEYGPGFMVWIILWNVYIFIAIALLLVDMRSKDPAHKDICTTLLAGLLIPTIFETLSGVLSSLNIVPETILANLAMLAFLIFFRYAIYKRRIFAITPKKEVLKDDPDPVKWDLPPGHIYRIEGEPAATTYGLFKDLVHSGLFGLVFSRKLPDMVKEETGLKETPMVWISSTRQEGQRNVAPSEIGQVVQIVKEFINKAEGTVILLDGLEYLIFENGPKITLTALFLLSEIVTIHNSRILVPIDPAALDDNTLGLLQRETTDLRTVKGFE